MSKIRHISIKVPEPVLEIEVLVSMDSFGYVCISRHSKNRLLDIRGVFF